MSNASLTFRPVAQSWSITGYINNIEDKRRANLSYYNDPTSTYAKVYSAPQTYGVRINYAF
jgi:iron complex outermembrane receptor protein